MNKKVKKIFQSNEPYIFLIIILLGIVVQIRSGQFFTANNIVDLLSAMIVPGLFAIAEFMALIAGGIDVSFPALASLLPMPQQSSFLTRITKEMFFWHL